MLYLFCFSYFNYTNPSRDSLVISLGLQNTTTDNSVHVQVKYAKRVSFYYNLDFKKASHFILKSCYIEYNLSHVWHSPY